MTDAIREKLKSYVQSKLTTPELLAMLAEEAAELGHAALKLRRVLDGTNPTPVTFTEAAGKLQEEVADVMLCISVMDYAFEANDDTAHDIQDRKLRRWADRLREKEET